MTCWLRPGQHLWWLVDGTPVHATGKPCCLQAVPCHAMPSPAIALASHAVLSRTQLAQLNPRSPAAGHDAAHPLQILALHSRARSASEWRQPYEEASGNLERGGGAMYLAWRNASLRFACF